MARMVAARSVVAAAVVGVAVGAAVVSGQAPPTYDAAQRRILLEKLQVAGSALYVGAHPDDENTALLAYLAEGRKVRTAYLSLTRGDGGQNLVGTEQGELLGVLRTQELLAARRIDGAEQFFTRAVDFGYSKTPAETLRIWGKDAVLADMVWIIRRFRPDVIITRFPTNGDGGHGHHTASALLAAEAFSAAADPARFPEQLTWAAPWQATRLLWNAWRRPGEEKVGARPGEIVVDLGAYSSVLGESYTEIAAASRSMHKSQGFGSTARRGSVPNYFQVVAGAPAKDDLFDGIDLTWHRVAGGSAIIAALDRVMAADCGDDPGAAVPALLDAQAIVDRLPANPLLVHLRSELVRATRVCLGLWLEAIAEQPTASPGSRVKVSVAAVDRSKVAVELVKVDLSVPTEGSVASANLIDNGVAAGDLMASIPKDAPLSQPYWLVDGHATGVYPSPEQRRVGDPENPPAVIATFVIRVLGRELRFDEPVRYRSTDPVEGERYRPFLIVPPLTASLEAPVLIFPDTKARQVRVEVHAFEPDVSASVRLAAPAGWSVTPREIPVQLAARDDDRSVTFTVTPPELESSGELKVMVKTDHEEAAHALVVVDHPHIPLQAVLMEASGKVVRVDVRRPFENVGYVMGPGDEVPDVLRQLGFTVELLTDEVIEKEDLSRFGAIVIGVRAFNTRAALARLAPRLLAWASAGGTLVVQYNNDRGLVSKALGPAPITLSRDRVTDEDAAVRILKPGHPLLSTPQAISARDFAGWVQERGLYFPSSWDPSYDALLEMADPGEAPTRGALLYARVGKGAYIYTGLAFFRQLPAGVPGAIRLFVNLLAGGRARE